MAIYHLLPILIAAATADPGRGSRADFTVEHTYNGYWVAACTVDRGELIRRCTPVPDPLYPPNPLDRSSAQMQRKLIAEARRHPHRLPGAAVGSVVQVLLRNPGWSDEPGDAWSLEEAKTRLFPDKDQVAGFSGRTSVSCTVLAGGKPDACWLTQETPPGKGLGYAALSLAAWARFGPPSAPGEVRSLDLAWQPPPPNPLLTVSCGVRADATSTDCTTAPDPVHPGANEQVLQALAVHPLRLDGAQPGSRLDVRLDREATLARTATEPLMNSDPAYVAAWRLQAPPGGLERWYPPRGNTMEKSGRSVVRCRVVQRRFDQCRVLSETPPGFGFAEAHMKLAPHVTLTPKEPHDPPPEGRPFDFAIHWSPRGEDTSPERLPTARPSQPQGAGVHGRP